MVKYCSSSASGVVMESSVVVSMAIVVTVSGVVAVTVLKVGVIVVESRHRVTSNVLRVLKFEFTDEQFPDESEHNRQHSVELLELLLQQRCGSIALVVPWKTERRINND